MAKELIHRDEKSRCTNHVNESNIIITIPNTPLLCEIFHHTLPHWPSKVLFKGWKFPQKRWKEWVERLAGKYAAVWNKAGICDAIMSSIYEVRCNRDLVLGVSEFWCSETNTFVFPWGEATVTLEDIMILGGLPVIGEPVISPLDGEMMKIVEELEKQRVEVCRSRSKKAAHCVWIARFMEEKGSELEHVGFLSLWLSRFLFPSHSEETVGKHVFPIAVKLLRGKQVALGPAVLASIYRDLGLMREGIFALTETISVTGPFHLLQLWAFERFSLLAPKSPNLLECGEPRVARWHKLSSKVSNLPIVRSAVLVAENFQWRPYAGDLENWRHPSYYKEFVQSLINDSSLDVELRSFSRCLEACELIGVDSKEKYLPHRVAMQFGLDQDVPVDFKFSGKKDRFFVQSRSFQPHVTERYVKWWKDMMLNRETAIKKDLTQNRFAKFSRFLSPAEGKRSMKDCCDSVASRDPFHSRALSQASDVPAKVKERVSYYSISSDDDNLPISTRLDSLCHSAKSRDGSLNLPHNVVSSTSKIDIEGGSKRELNATTKGVLHGKVIPKSASLGSEIPASVARKNRKGGHAPVQLAKQSQVSKMSINEERKDPMLPSSRINLQYRDLTSDDDIIVVKNFRPSNAWERSTGSREGLTCNLPQHVASSSPCVPYKNSREQKPLRETEGNLQKIKKQNGVAGEVKEKFKVKNSRNNQNEVAREVKKKVCSFDTDPLDMTLLSVRIKQLKSIKRAGKGVDGEWAMNRARNSSTSKIGILNSRKRKLQAAKDGILLGSKNLPPAGAENREGGHAAIGSRTIKSPVKLSQVSKKSINKESKESMASFSRINLQYQDLSMDDDFINAKRIRSAHEGLTSSCPCARNENSREQQLKKTAGDSQKIKVNNTSSNQNGVGEVKNKVRSPTDPLDITVLSERIKWLRGSNKSVKRVAEKLEIKEGRNSSKKIVKVMMGRSILVQVNLENLV